MAAKRYWSLDSSTVERLPDQLVSVCEQPGIMVTPHWHAQAEVNYLIRGEITYQMQGHRARIGAGELALFWGGLPHQVVDTAEDSLFHVTHLPLFHFFRLRLSPELQARLMQGAVLLTADAQPEDSFAFPRWSSQLASGDPRRVGHAVDELLLRLERIELEEHRLLQPSDSRPEAAEPSDPPTLQCIRRICGFIAANFREDIACTDIASAADIHPKYAMSVFRKATGLSLHEYLSLLRVSYAQALLADDGANVLQVALESGFGSLSAFNKCFRKKAGMTPREFKREHRLIPHPHSLV
jgi:AraC-like DNA-binding protein